MEKKFTFHIFNDNRSIDIFKKKDLVFLLLVWILDIGKYVGIFWAPKIYVFKINIYVKGLKVSLNLQIYFL